MSKLKVLFAMFAVVLGIGFTTSTAHAEDLTSGNGKPHIVDNFKFLTNTVNQGEITSLTVSFTEKFNDQIKPGDTLKLQLPDGLKGMLNNGKPAYLKLKDANGTEFAQVTIGEKDILVEFLSAVKPLNNIKGHFNIAVIAVNEGRPNDLTINPLTLGLPATNSEGKPMNSEGLTIRGVPKYVETAPEGEFNHHKQGDMVSGVGNVRWFINVNDRQQKIDKFDQDIVIEDTIGPGQKFQEGSFNVSRTKWNPTLGKNETKWEKIDDLVRAGWATIVQRPTADSRSFKVILHVSTKPEFTGEISGQSFALSYITDVIDDTLTEFTNDLDISYKVSGKDPVADKQTYKTKNIRLDGGASGDAGVTPPLNMHDFTEFQETVEELDEIVVPIPEDPNKEDKAKESQQPDESVKAEETKKPEILNDAQIVEEVLEDEQLEMLDDIIQEHIEGGLEEGHTHEVEINGEVHVLTDEQIIDQLLTPEQKEKLKDVIERDKKKQKKSEAKPAPKKAQSKKSESTKTKKSEDLPATGYNNEVLLTIVGSMLALFTVFLFTKMRKNNK